MMAQIPGVQPKTNFPPIQHYIEINFPLIQNCIMVPDIPTHPQDKTKLKSNQTLGHHLSMKQNFMTIRVIDWKKVFRAKIGV
jgi:hypothetical protein